MQSQFVEGRVHTGFIEEHSDSLLSEQPLPNSALVQVLSPTNITLLLILLFFSNGSIKLCCSYFTVFVIVQFVQQKTMFVNSSLKTGMLVVKT